VRPAKPQGFTLVEVLLALTLGALVVLAAHRVFTGVADGAIRLREARISLDREANARRWLSAAFASIDIGTPGGGFTGRPDQVQFSAWLLNQQGWYSLRQVTLVRHDQQLLAETPSDESIVLADSVSDFALDYLLDVRSDGASDSTTGAPGERARFVSEWISPASAPVAIRVRIAHGGDEASAGRVDTLLIIVGPRG
jgi:prepilin-type N-terminal cleavage/methylation domain-containing protein